MIRNVLKNYSNIEREYDPIPAFEEPVYETIRLLKILGHDGYLLENDLNYLFENLSINLKYNFKDKITISCKSEKDRILLFKGLVLEEKLREFIKGKKINSDRSSLVHYIFGDELLYLYPELLKWTFKNRSSNKFTPFGEKSWLFAYDSFDDIYNAYKDEIEEKRLEKFYEYYSEGYCKIDKNRFAKEVNSHLRTIFYKGKIKSFIMSNPNIIESIVNDKLEFPINMLPEKLIDEIVKELNKLSYFVLISIRAKIPRRPSYSLKCLKNSITDTIRNNRNKFPLLVYEHTPTKRKDK